MSSATAKKQADAGPDILKLLREVSLFEEIRKEEKALATLVELMEPCEFQKGDFILREGTVGAEMYILFSGEASVYKSTPDGEGYKVSILSGANRPFLGEGALLESDSRSATIKAETHCECLSLNRKNFNAFCKENPQWALPIVLRIARAILGRVHKMNGDFMLLYKALVAEIRGHH